jgi:transcriptional regulator with XRE-family HTH domain
LSKIENDKVDFAAFPSEATIRKLARALAAEEDELLLLAEKIPDHIRSGCWSARTPFASSPNPTTRRSTRYWQPSDQGERPPWPDWLECPLRSDGVAFLACEPAPVL